MNWLDATRFERRPLVFVEDHLYHTSEVLAAVHAARPDLVSCITAVALESAGPDTDATVAEWLDRYQALQIVAPVDLARAPSRAARDRLLPIAPSDLADAAAYARLVARLLRPDGVLIQDIQLTTLSFLPADRWWESIYLAATVRGLFANRAPTVRFLSNKRGYSATFGRELMDAGFDPRDVMDKAAVATTVVPALATLFDRTFSLSLDASIGGHVRFHRPLATGEAERCEVEAGLDLVLWVTTHAAELGGRIVAASVPGQAGRVALRAGSPEIETWTTLIEDRLSQADGVPVVSVGSRIGPKDAERAELTNLAARHLHALRSRLTDAEAIVTARHAYHLAGRFSVGIVRPRATFGSAGSDTKVAG